MNRTTTTSGNATTVTLTCPMDEPQKPMPPGPPTDADIKRAASDISTAIRSAAESICLAIIFAAILGGCIAHC